MSELDPYDYELPPERIAQQPLADRAQARLLVVDRRRNALEHRQIRDLPQLLLPGDMLVLNETRVVPARLMGRRTATGGAWEGLFLSLDADGSWRVLSQTRGKLQPGETVTLVDPAGNDAAQLAMLARHEGGVWTARPEGVASSADAFALLDRAGRVPLPPYIRHGEMTPEDRQNYQTVFAQVPGAVAAPTAGLHFTRELLDQLAARGIESARVTLHVGLGTFRPIAGERLDEHVMHSEWGEIAPAAVARLAECRARGGRIVSIGTTSVRVLETASASGELAAWSGWTELFIRPPYRFRSVDALLTNFHLPRSTLLVLVQTLGGEELIRRAYTEAIAREYRFYSYGDAMLIV
jgi:S-adenosylmethionine:tRNA ribosyltransferase-isomerase